MRSNIKLGKISGIEIGLNYSWFIIAALIVFSLAARFRQVNANWGSGKIWIAALVTAVLFFVCLLLHELAHSLVAQTRGLKVKAITLFALGGVSQFQDDATDAKTEFWVAIAGPITSLLIGFVCLLVAPLLGWQNANAPHNAVTGVLFWLGYINVGLGVFNLIPGFPLDGGRVLRAIVWAVTRDADRATRVAAGVGQVVAFLFILYGIWQFFSGAGFGGLWIAFIGWFLMDAARASRVELEATTALRGVRVSDLMLRDCISVDPQMSLPAFIENYLLQGGQRCFAVEDQGRLLGIITPRDVAAVPRDLWDRSTVGQAMRQLKDLSVVTPDTPVLDALKLMARNDVNQLPVVANGGLQGMFSRAQLLQFLQVRSDLRFPAASQQPLRREARKTA